MAWDEIFCICFILNLIIHGLKEYLRLVRNILTFIVIIKASLTLLLCCKCGQASHARTLWMNQNSYTLYLCIINVDIFRSGRKYKKRIIWLIIMAVNNNDK